MARTRPNPWPKHIREWHNAISDERLLQVLGEFVDRQWKGLKTTYPDRAEKFRRIAIDIMAGAVRVEEAKGALRGTAIERVYDTIDTYTAYEMNGREQSLFPFGFLHVVMGYGYTFTDGLFLFQEIVKQASGVPDETALAQHLFPLQDLCVALLTAAEEHGHGERFRAESDAPIMAIHLAQAMLSWAREIGQGFSPNVRVFVSDPSATAVELVAIAVELGYRKKKFDALLASHGETLITLLSLLANFPALRRRDVFTFLLEERDMDELKNAFSRAEDFIAALALRDTHFSSLSLASLTAIVAAVGKLDDVAAMLTLTSDVHVARAIVAARTRWNITLSALVTTLHDTQRFVPLSLAASTLAHCPPTVLAHFLQTLPQPARTSFCDAFAVLPRDTVTTIARACAPTSVVAYQCLRELTTTFSSHAPTDLARIGELVSWDCSRARLLVRAERRGIPASWGARYAEDDLDRLTVRFHLEDLMGRKPTNLEVSGCLCELSGAPSRTTVRKFLKRCLPQKRVETPKATAPLPAAVRVAKRHAQPQTIACVDLVPDGIDAAHAASILTWGFLMPTQSRKFIGANAIPVRHVRSNTARKLGGVFDGDAFAKALDWLQRIGTVGTRGGGRPSNLVLSVALKSGDPVGQALIDRAIAFARLS